MKHKKHIITSLLLVIGIMMMAMSATYAYLFLTNNNTPIETTIQTGEIQLDFQTTNVINNPKMFLIKPENISQEAERLDFSIAHGVRSTKSFAYKIELSEIVISDNFKDSDFKWELTLSGTNTKYSGNFSAIGTETSLVLTTNGIILDTTETHNYVLRLWLEETSENQNHLLEGNFSAKIKVDAYR